jgi:cardiolipin synthase
MIDPMGIRPISQEARHPAAEMQKPEPQVMSDGVEVKGDKGSSFKDKLKKLKTAALGLKGRTYITSVGIGGIALGIAGGMLFGPLGAVAGIVAGVSGGLAAGAVMNSPFAWFKGRGREGGEIPPGSDVLLDPALKDPVLLKPETAQALDETTDSTAVAGNSVSLMKNGVASFPERYRMMEQAKHSINLQTLIFHSDETGWKTAELLARKAKEGVRCRVIYDWISSADSDPKIFTMMKNADVELQAFNTPLDYQWHDSNRKEIAEYVREAAKDFSKALKPEDLKNLGRWIKWKGRKDFDFWKRNNEKTLERLKEYPPLLHKLNNRWHMKILSVDGSEAMLGGMNIGSEYANGGTSRRDLSQGEGSFSAGAFRDTDVKVAGPVVERVNRTFAQNWVDAGGSDPDTITSENPAPSETGGTTTRFIAHQPREKKDRNIESWYYGMLGKAEKTAYITNAYFLPTGDFRKALTDAAHRGVDVRILTNSVETNDLPILSQGGRFFYRELLEAGVRIYEMRKDNPGGFTTLHTKASVFDGVAGTVGSHNLDPRSFSLNSEDTLCVDDREFAGQMQRMFKEDLESSREITLADLDKETPSDQVEQWFAAQILKDLL